MEKINAVITGIGGYVPEYVLNNDELSRMVDTNDEWIMTRIGVKERRIYFYSGLSFPLCGFYCHWQVGVDECFCIRLAGSLQRIPFRYGYGFRFD